MINSEKTILVIHKDNGKFYKAIGSDAEILNYLLDYQIINNRVGFPDNEFDKVCDVLEKNKISYQIIYSEINPIYKDYGEENNYLNILKNAKINCEITKRMIMIIERIKNLDDCDKKRIIKKIEEIINMS